MADTKLCNRCKEHKEFECFVKGNCKFGLSNWCRTCNKDFKQTIRKPKEINKNIEGEIWEDVKGYEGLYQISNFGRVFSLEKSTINNGFAAIKFAFFVKTNIRCGYLVVRLFKSGNAKTYPIHRLIAINFIPNILNKPCINHIDRNRQNNAIENLEWVTYRENASHATKLLITKTSPFTGVSWNKNYNKWVSYIQINKKRNHLGYFVNELDAKVAYEDALLQHGLTNKYA